MQQHLILDTLAITCNRVQLVTRSARDGVALTAAVARETDAGKYRPYRACNDNELR